MKTASLFTLCLVTGTALADSHTDQASAPLWSGCQAGLNVGAAWLETEGAFIDYVVPDNTGGYDMPDASGTGVAGGGQAGCSLQRGRLVFGLEGMFDGTGTDQRENLPSAGFADEIYTTEMNWFATVTGKIGVTITPQLLVYAKGGAAFMETDYTDEAADATYRATGDDSHTGWTAGGGATYALDAHWSVFGEYNYLDFGSSRVTLTSEIDTATYPDWINRYDHKVHAVIFGANYRF